MPRRCWKLALGKGRQHHGQSCYSSLLVMCCPRAYIFAWAAWVSPTCCPTSLAIFLSACLLGCSTQTLFVSFGICLGVKELLVMLFCGRAHCQCLGFPTEDLHAPLWSRFLEAHMPLVEQLSYPLSWLRPFEPWAETYFETAGACIHGRRWQKEMRRQKGYFERLPAPWFEIEYVLQIFQ